MAMAGGLRGRKLSLAVWGVAMWAIIISGFNQASAGGILGNANFLEQFPQLNASGPDAQHKSTIQGTVVALYTLCSAFGSLATSYFGDALGRRLTIFIGAAISAVGAVLMGTSFSLAQFIVSRIVAGLGTGGITATVSAWHAELSRAEDRGSHVSGFGFFVSAGLAVALWLEFGMSYTQGAVSWRFPLSFPAILALVAMSLIFTVPESPRWLIKRNRVSEARRILGQVYEADENSDIVDNEVKAIQVSMELAGNASFSHLFSMGQQRTLHRLGIAFSIMMFLQISGINSIAYYAPQIFENELHFPAATSGILAASSQLCLCAGAIVCSLLVDRLGRRKLLLFSATMMSVCMACLAGLASVPGNKAAANVGVFFVFLYYFVYVIGFLGIPFLYASEIAPVHLRAGICGLSTAGCWLFNFVVVEITPVAFNNIGYRYFIVYAVINAVCVPTIYFFYPETMGRSLEEIDQIFIGSKSIFDPVRLARTLPKDGRAERVEHLVEDNRLDDKEGFRTDAGETQAE